MNKVVLLLVLVGFTALPCIAQTRSYSSDEGRAKTRTNTTCPKVYLGLSSGINNPVGLIGVGVDVAVDPRVTVGGGVGLSSWGTKVAIEGRYYFDECNRGWALGGGLTSSSGARNITLQLETVQYGAATPVLLDLHRKTNIFFSGYRFFNLGRSSRFHLQLGYSFGLRNAEYKVKSGVTLTSASDMVVRTISPGGVILGLGFTFGVGR